MKRFFVFTFVVLFIIVFNVSIGAYCEKNTDMQILKLQTVGASDSDFDQYIKYEISDSVDSYISNLFDVYEVADISEAVEVLENNIGRIRAVCVNVANREGCYEPIYIKLVETKGENYSSARVINDEKNPTLRIEIGEGRGHNCQKVVWDQKSSIEKKFSKGLTLAQSFLPSEVKFDFWIVGALKKIISSFE